MKRHRLLAWAAALTATLLASTSCNKGAVQTVFSIYQQEQAARGLIERTVGEDYAQFFAVEIVPNVQEANDWFELSTKSGKIVLRGNNGISVASALNHYLKESCNCHISWCGDNMTLPEVLPLPTENVRRESPYKYRYYLNYCTFNYTMSWWDEERWQREIDFMALNGINMPLAVTGQNSVWQRVYRRLGFTDEELEGFFSGPAYFNWFWMGNLDGWGGPLPQSFMERHEELQKFILHSERSLGMTPVLPAFTGHVPAAFEIRFPEAKVRHTSWVNFPEVALLDPDEELFSTIGEMFIEEQTKLYGTNHLYSADTFNENLPPTGDSLFLSGMSRKVYESMRAADKDAVWIMQGWLFYHERSFWGEKEIRSLLGAVPDDKMIILDLWSERFPVWSRTEAYYGKPWIWCMLHNFGQNTTLSGNVGEIANSPSAALANPDAGQMKGIGLTMEGIEQTPFIYAMMLENVWSDKAVDVDRFIASYQRQRYGKENPDAFAAWKLLSTTVFENTSNNGGHESILTARPTYKLNPRGTANTEAGYQRSPIVDAWDMMNSASEELSASDGFRYDLVDITRQVLADYASDCQQECASAYHAGNPKRFAAAAERFLQLASDMDALLATRSEFLLGRWIESAKAMGTTPQESALYEKNARDLLTLWGDRDCRIHDYACRQWSGLIEGFYRPRWQQFFDYTLSCMNRGEKIDQKAFEQRMKDWEWQWVCGNEPYTTTTSGDEISECNRIYLKYRPLVN